MKNQHPSFKTFLRLLLWFVLWLIYVFIFLIILISINPNAKPTVPVIIGLGAPIIPIIIYVFRNEGKNENSNQISNAPAIKTISPDYPSSTKPNNLSEYSIDRIDNMDGIAFEEFCASLLGKKRI